MTINRQLLTKITKLCQVVSKNETKSKRSHQNPIARYSRNKGRNIESKNETKNRSINLMEQKKGRKWAQAKSQKTHEFQQKTKGSGYCGDGGLAERDAQVATAMAGERE